MNGEWSGIIGSIANVIATALALVSICITIRENKQLRIDEREHRKLEQKLLWYNEIVLNNLIPAINHFVDGSREQLEHLYESQNKQTLEMELKQVYDNIKDEFKAINMYLLKSFSNDLYHSCDTKLQNILDQYSNIINEAQEKKRLYRISMVKIHKERESIFMDLCEWSDHFGDGNI